MGHKKTIEREETQKTYFLWKWNSRSMYPILSDNNIGDDGARVIANNQPYVLTLIRANCCFLFYKITEQSSFVECPVSCS